MGGGDVPIESSSELDLVICMDSTGSMGSYIKQAQESVRQIVNKLQQEEKCDVRFALVAYRDHPPQDSTFVTSVFPFTSDVQAMQDAVDSMKAAGGGDGPEAVTAALQDVLQLPYRPNAAKVVVLIADAPPHGLEPRGDGFPNGDPEGRDPLLIAKDLSALGVTIYPVGCEPALGQYEFARDFMCNLAELTNGQAIPLSSAALLPAVILGGAAEEVALETLSREVEREMQRPELAGLDEEAVAERVQTSLQLQGKKSKHLRSDGEWMQSAVSRAAFKGGSLAAAKSKLCEDVGLHDEGFGGFGVRSMSARSAPRGGMVSRPPPAPGAPPPPPPGAAKKKKGKGESGWTNPFTSASGAGTGAAGSTSIACSYAEVEEDDVSKTQVLKMMKKLKVKQASASRPPQAV